MTTSKFQKNGEKHVFVHKSASQNTFNTDLIEVKGGKSRNQGGIKAIKSSDGPENQVLHSSIRRTLEGG